MKIREDRKPAVQKIQPLHERIVRQYDLNIDLNTDLDHLRQILEHYSAKRELLLAKLGESGAIKNPTYAKAVLISETVRMFLREIAPKRTRRKRK